MIRQAARFIVVLFALSIIATFASPAAAADPQVCVTYDFAGSELCVSENGIDDQGPLLPEPIWHCVIYDFAGSKICVSSHGQIDPSP